MRLHRHGLRFPAEAALGAWLYKVTVNLCLDRARAARPSGELKDLDKDTEQTMRLPNTQGSAQAPFATAQIRIHPESVSRRDTGRYVRFYRMNIGFRIPYTVRDAATYQFMEVGLNTAGDFKEGQKSVLGKVSGIDDESAIFVVVSLKVLD